MTGGVNKVFPPTKPAACPHGHLQFEDGSFALRCIDCNQRWAAVDAKGGAAFMLKGVPIYPPRDTRHDRWELARTAPLKKL